MYILLKVNCRKILFFYSLLLCNAAVMHAQKTSVPAQKQGSWEWYALMVDSSEANPSKSRAFAKSWLQKAKSLDQLKQQAAAYTALMHLAPQNQKMAWSDSIIVAAELSGDDTTTGQAYISRGVQQFRARQYGLALKDYLVANSFVAKTKDRYLENKVRFMIAQLKYAMGYTDEAQSMFAECKSYFKDREDRAYLRAVHGLALCYVREGEWKKAGTEIAGGILQAYEYDDGDMVPYLMQAHGMNEFVRKDYRSSIRQLKMALPAIIDNSDFANESLLWLYMGKNYWALKQKDTAVFYFRKVDKIFQKYGFITPEAREAYVRIASWYEAAGDNSNHVHYLKMLQQAHKFVEERYYPVRETLLREYSPDERLQKAESGILRERLVYGTVVAILAVIILWFLYRKGRKRVANEPVDLPVVRKKTAAEHFASINPEIVASVLQKLEVFKKKKGFLKKGLDQEQLAALLHTNGKYAGQIIMHVEGKNTVAFVNDLRIAYCLEQLRTDPDWPKYSVDTLASGSGFSSRKTFSAAFRSITGVNPSEYIARPNTLRE